MGAGPSSARPTRARHRHELRTLTYVTLDQANGGIVRNLSHDGIAVQAVAAVRPRQQLRVRFELRYPRLRVETRGEVVWSTFSGQCGIRFLDLSPRFVRQIDEWIFGDLLEGSSIPWERAGSLYTDAASSIAGKSTLSQSSFIPTGFIPAAFPGPTARVLGEVGREHGVPGHADPGHAELGPAVVGRTQVDADEEDGLIVSPAPVKVIELPPPVAASGLAASFASPADVSSIPGHRSELDWLSQPLSTRSLAWTVDTLVVIAAFLLFAFVFLSVTREAPKWPFALTTGGAIAMGGLYWGFFKIFGGSSLGARLARLAESSNEDIGEPPGVRFR